MSLPLIPLHRDDQLIPSKIESLRKLSTDQIRKSLLPGSVSALKCRPDGTILDGHHRCKVLRERSVDVNQLPREIIPKVIDLQ